MAAAAAVAHAARLPGCVAIADTCDNINGGAPGDTTWLLHEVRKYPGVTALATLWDPQALETVRTAGTGSHVRVRLGGHAAATSGPPLDVEVEVRRLGSGTFTHAGPMATGATTSMGAAAVVRAGDVDVVVQGRPTQPNDPQLFRSLGIEPSDYDVVILKGASALRASWEPLAVAVVDAATPGVTDSDLSRLIFRNAPPGLLRATLTTTG